MWFNIFVMAALGFVAWFIVFIIVVFVGSIVEGVSTSKQRIQSAKEDYNRLHQRLVEFSKIAHVGINDDKIQDAMFHLGTLRTGTQQLYAIVNISELVLEDLDHPENEGTLRYLSEAATAFVNRNSTEIIRLAYDTAVNDCKATIENLTAAIDDIGEGK